MAEHHLSAEGIKGPNESTMEAALEQAKRAFAVKNYELSIEQYATALEIVTKRYGDASPECADLYFAYGRALLENAINQNSVFGKDKEETEYAEEEENKGGVEAEGEPEDDFNAAWDVLEVARSLYENQKEVGDNVQLRLADTYIALGDISLETEKLEQAAMDYAAAAALKSNLLPIFSRQIAEVHYKLCIVNDLTLGRLPQAIEHARQAQASVRARLTEIAAQLSTRTETTIDETENPRLDGKIDLKENGEASLTTALEPPLNTLTKSQLEAEVKDLAELLNEVSLKIEELKTSSNTLEGSAPELVAKELDRELNDAKGLSSAAPKEIHNLTNVVRKKRKAPEMTEVQAEKKAKMESDNDTPSS